MSPPSPPSASSVWLLWARRVGCLRPLSNENEVRGLWSVIIFIWVTVGGCSTFVSPTCDTSLSSSGGNEERALVTCWDDTSKNNCYLPLATHDERGEQSRNTSEGVTSFDKIVSLGGGRNTRREDRSPGAGAGARMSLIMWITSKVCNYNTAGAFLFCQHQ